MSSHRRRFLTAEAWVQQHTNPWGICDRVGRFSHGTSGLPADNFTKARYLRVSSILWTVWEAWLSSTSSHPQFPVWVSLVMLGWDIRKFNYVTTCISVCWEQCLYIHTSNMAERCFMGLLLRDSSVGIATVGVRKPAGVRFFSSPPRPHRLGVYPASYPMGTLGDFPGGKVAGAWS
jgi:hypothetical protein